MAVKKSKEKTLFVIHWYGKYRTAVTKSLLRRFGLIVTTLFILLTVGVGSNALPYAYAVVKCLGPPVETSNFMGSHTFNAPGDERYGLDPFSSYKFCTRDEAKTAGYMPQTMNESEQKAAMDQEKARAEVKRFSTSKVNYVVYAPVLEGYEVADLEMRDVQGIHTFMSVKKNGTVIGKIRELGVSDSYNNMQKI